MQRQRPPAAAMLIAKLDYDGYFLEYDSERTGGFEPLRSQPNADSPQPRRETSFMTTNSGQS